MLNQQTIHDMLSKPGVQKMPSFVPQQLERHYDQFLCSLQFSPSLKGYPYIKQALYHEHRNRHNLPSLNKDIYGEISRLYNTQFSAVERCITFSVRKAYNQNPEGFLKLFPHCKKAPSNFLFLKTMSLHLNHFEE